MVNKLLADRDASPVDIITKEPNAKTRGYSSLFALMDNAIKYGTAVSDIYNFDETGFMMGVISIGMVVTSVERRPNTKLAQPRNGEWSIVIQGVGSEGCPPPQDWVIATSDNGWTINEGGLEWFGMSISHTKPRTTSEYRLLILDGHHSADFELYCKEHKIITLCMAAHSSHILQPLDVGCFGPLKQANGRQIKDKMRAGTTHIADEDFFPTLLAAFQPSVTEKNIQGGFRGACRVTLDPGSVISRLDVKLRNPTPVEEVDELPAPWASQTPHNPTEASSQSESIKNQVARQRKLSDINFARCRPLRKKGPRNHASDCFIEVGEPDFWTGE